MMLHFQTSDVDTALYIVQPIMYISFPASNIPQRNFDLFSHDLSTAKLFQMLMTRRPHVKAAGNNGKSQALQPNLVHYQKTEAADRCRLLPAMMARVLRCNLVWCPARKGRPHSKGLQALQLGKYGTLQRTGRLHSKGLLL